METPFKRRGSTTAAGERHASLLPQPAGFYSHDRTGIEPPSHSEHSRLLPLSTSTPTCTASAERLTAGSLDLPALDSTRPRSQSLFDLVQHARCEPGQIESGKAVVPLVVYVCTSCPAPSCSRRIASLPASSCQSTAQRTQLNSQQLAEAGDRADKTMACTAGPQFLCPSSGHRLAAFSVGQFPRCSRGRGTDLLFIRLQWPSMFQHSLFNAQARLWVDGLGCHGQIAGANRPTLARRRRSHNIFFLPCSVFFLLLVCHK